MMKLFHLKSWGVLTLTTLSAISQPLCAQSDNDIQVLDYPFGTSLYYLYQNKPLSAITEIESGKYRNAFTRQPDDAELLLGGLYFGYGLTDDAEQIFNRLLEQKKSVPTQDRIWFNLARVQFEQGNFEQAQELLSRISSPLPQQREQQRQYLLSSLYTKKQDFEQASEALKKIDSTSIWRAYAEYNLAVARIAAGQTEAGYQGLEDLADLKIAGDEFAGLLDASQLALGLNSLKHEENDAAIEHFLKIRFSGPISNKALLGIGWAWSQKSDLDKAIGYWQALQKKTQIDGATLESYLAIPYALELKQRKKLAIEYYRQAAANFDIILQEQEIIISQIQQDQLIDTLIQNHIIEDTSIKQLNNSELEKNTPNYLYTLIADKHFQQQLGAYQDLLNILDTLLRWDDNIPVLALMLKERRATFERKRPAIENTVEYENLSKLQTQVDELSSRVESVEQHEDYLALANADESEYLQQLDDVKSMIDQLDQQRDLSVEKNKYRLLKGLLQYEIEIDYPTRSWGIKSAMKSLAEAMQETTDSAQSLSLAASMNDKLLNEFDQRISGQVSVINQLLTQVDNLLNRQKNYLNQIAINALNQQQQHIKQLRLSARYSLARLYDDLSSDGKKND